MAKSVLHVVPQDQHWAVKREGSDRASSTHDTQKEAIEAARDLAKELDDIVIHRTDGTIRERVTYTGSSSNGSTASNGSNGSNGSNAYETREVEDIVRPRNLASVGSRVSWSAVFAGVVVGAAVYTLLMTLAVAIGLSSIDQMSPKSFTVTAGIIGAVILLASMFLGGFIASRTTVGEQPSEAATYGILVWGAMTLLMLAIGLGSGLGYLGGTRQAGAAPGVTLSPELSQKLELTPRQQELFTQHYRTADVSPQEVAWWTFGGVAASLLAAIGGGLVGAGPQMVARPARDTRTVAVVPQPA